MGIDEIKFSAGHQGQLSSAGLTAFLDCHHLHLTSFSFSFSCISHHHLHFRLFCKSSPAGIGFKVGSFRLSSKTLGPHIYGKFCNTVANEIGFPFKLKQPCSLNRDI